LVNHYFNLLSKKLGKHISGIHKDVYELLLSYPFPGNIRELKNIMERAIIICDTEQIMPQHFLSVSTTAVNLNDQKADNDIFDLQELEKQTIIKALKKVNFNKAEAARLLNIEWNALYRRIQKFDIDFPATLS
jgi:transcriptional regulator with PAS, ATPase and Fis domain